MTVDLPEPAKRRKRAYTQEDDAPKSESMFEEGSISTKPGKKANTVNYTVRLPYTREALLNRVANGRALPKFIKLKELE